MAYIRSTSFRYKHSPESLLKWIVLYKEAHDGDSPSIREIQDALGISSTSVVEYLLKKLAGDGKIRREPNRKSIEVVGGEWKYNP